MTYRLITILFYCSTIMSITAQQPAQYTLFRYNLFDVNPAYAGKDGSLCANATIRQQWAGFAGAPQTQALNAHLPINYISSGVGINLESDKEGIQQGIQAALSYAYDIRLSKKAKLSLGLRGGITQMTWNGAAVRTPDGNYQTGNVEHKDGILTNINFGGAAPLLDAGALFHNDMFKIGVAVKNLTQNSLNYTIINGKIRLVTNYFFTFAADFNLGENFKLLPSLLFKSDIAENQLNIDMAVLLYDKFTVGTGFRGYNKNSTDAINFIGGIKLNEKIKLYYAYDFNISALKSTNNGSHELLLQYNLNASIGKGIPEKIIFNPRYY